MKRISLFLGIALIWLGIWGSHVPLASAHAASGGPTTAHHIGAQVSMRAAVFCSGTGCNHQDPYAMGCNWSMYTVATAYLNAGSVTGRVELEYSSVCQTNWAQISSGNSVEYLAGNVVRAAGPDGPFDVDYYSSTVYSWINTNMLWSPHNLDEAGGCFEQQCTGSGSGLNSGYWVQTGSY